MSYADEYRVLADNALNGFVDQKLAVKQAEITQLTQQLATATTAKEAAQAALAEANQSLAAEHSARLAAEAALAAAEQEVDSLTATLATRNATIQSLQGTIATRDAQIVTLNQTISDRNQTISARDAEIVTLTARIAELEAQLPPDAEPSGGLAFQRLESGHGDKKAFAHYFGPFPISIDNAARLDYWDRNWNLAVPGESGAHTGEGGYGRDRPVYRAPRSQSNWKYEDSKEDVRQALKGSLDGFFNNIMGIGGANEERYRNVALAASELVPDGRFKVVPMIDTNGSIGSATPQQIADTIAWYAFTNAVRGTTTGRTRRASSWFLTDNRFVVASYKADGKTAAWWQAIFNDLQTAYGINVAFIAVLSNYNNAASLDSVTWARGEWGNGADPNIAANYGDRVTSATAAGKKWMAPVWPQDVRSDGGLYDEARGTGSLRAHFERAIADDADFVQICTWSDYREGGEANQSVKKGLSVMDLSAYYIYKWKMQEEPEILRDGFYLSHRNQFLGSDSRTPSRTEFVATQDGAYPVGHWAANPATGRLADGMAGHWIRPNRSALQNEVEVVALCKEPATVTITVAGTTSTFNAPAGLSVHRVPLGIGTISATLKRGTTTLASLTSPALVREAPYNQDPAYHTFSTFPGRTPAEVGQYDYQGFLLANR